MATGFKHTEIGMIPEDWTTKNIVETSTMKARIGWQGLTVAEYLDKGDYFLITGTDFVDGKIKWETCYYVEKERYARDKNIQIRVGDILITKDGTIGKIAFIDRLPLPATLNSGVFVIRPKDEAYLPAFLFYVFNSCYFRDFLNKLVAGSTINHLYQKDFVSFNFPLPPLAEQTAIARVLSDTDALIQKLEQLIAKKRNLKTAAMQELLKPKEGWEVRTIAELGYVKSSSVDKLMRPNEKVVSLLNYMDVYKHSKITPSVITGSTTVNDVQLKTLNLLKGDVMFTPTSETPDDIGHASLIVSDLEKTVYSYHLTRLRFYSNEIVDELKPYLFNSKQLRNYFTLKATGSTRFVLKKKDFEDALIYYPKSKSEQTRIAQILSDMDSEIEALEKQLEKYKMLKQGMMQVLLTGKIRLNYDS